MIKKIFLTFFSLILLLSIVSIRYDFTVRADDYGYSFSCGNDFEVDYVTDDGKFESKGCYLSYKEAENKMKELGGDHVVRYNASLSPMKIVAMNSGFAYSYPGRNKSKTLNIYYSVDGTNLSDEKTYVERHYEMDYLATERVFTSEYGGKYNGKGMVKVSLNGYEGYCDLEAVDLVPSKMINSGLEFYVGGNNQLENENPYKLKIEQNYYFVKNEGGYKNLYFHYSRSFATNTIPTDIYNLCIGVGFDFMEPDVKYYSNDGVNFYFDGAYKNFAGQGFNYYQFLPLRSKTNITAEQLENYLSSKGITNKNSVMKDKAQSFIDAQNKYGMNALLIYGLAIHESSYGRSDIAIAKNNLFGLGAVDASPGTSAFTFDSVYDCLENFEGYHLEKYCDYNYAYYNSPVLGNKSVGANICYASDPYWGMKVASHAYAIDKYAAGGNGKLLDYNKYDLALITEFGVSFKDAPNGNKLYTSVYAYDRYQKNHVVITLESKDDYTKIQSTNPIENGQVVLTSKTKIPYDFDKSVVYVKTSYLKPLNNQNISVQIGEHKIEFTEFSWKNNKLILKGNTSYENLNEDATISLLFNNYEVELSTNREDEIITFEKEIELENLEEGEYILKLKTDYKNSNDYDVVDNVNYIYLPETKTINDKIFKFSISSNTITLKVSQKPDELISLISVDNAKLDENGIFSINGVGAIKGIDSDNVDNLSHKLILKSYDEEKQSYEFELETIENTWYSINDGLDYKYAGFNATVDLKDIELGNYALLLEITNGEYNITSYIKNADKAYSRQIRNIEDVTYRFNTNSLYSYRFEITKESTPLDYSLINKPSTRQSMVTYDHLKIEDEILKIDGIAMIYYLDYLLDGDIEYKVYLIDDKDNYLELENVNIENKYDYSQTLGSSYKLENIEFSAKGDLSSLQAGDYNLIIMIRNDDYLDYLEINNRTHANTPTAYGEINEYYIQTSSVRDKLVLKVR